MASTRDSSKSKRDSVQYESPLGYKIEDIRPDGDIEKFRCAAYSNVSSFVFSARNASRANSSLLLCSSSENHPDTPQKEEPVE
ncbi:hypothetical protein SELMODRAFT_134748 [Selaginella moellendorffii]|uniref:Uncharacterized protein n=1 Tax=Selaginella moellendorffii TaxID=88036 RepID=D8T963_SELML|nr:hypothetical protein SELMODRAFT_134748 [Selaginella moellendorffii]